ncbi:MAG: MmgE/PrpD family protein [Betaproteobacteria bacterium]
MTRHEFLKLASRGTGAAAAWSAVGPFGARAQAAPPPGPAPSPKAPPSGITDAVVAFIDGARFDDMPEAVVIQAKRCLIDGLGVALAGATVRGSAIVRDYVKTCGGRAEATVLGPEPLTVTAAQAALANGSSGHAMDYDDTQLPTTPDRVFGLLTHPTVPVMAASLALAERTGASGRAFLEAFLTGFEVECKIAEAINPDHYLRGFHSTGTIGTIGAAASAANLLHLQRPGIAHALGIAASMSAGIRVNFGSMTKPLHAGRAAENGVVAAELASRGFTAGDVALDGRWGFFEVMGGGADVARIVGALGNPYSIVTPGVSVKPYPCGSLGHPTMDAMMKLVTEHDIRPEQVKHVRVRAGSNILDPLRYKTAKTELEAKFCLPFMMSAILLRRRAGIREFTDAFVSSAPVQAIMARVETVFDPAIEARGFDRMRSVVEVELEDGRTFTQPSDERYRGGPERPFTREELHAKFTDCASLLLPDDRIRRALDLIESLERVANVRELVESLRA